MHVNSTGKQIRSSRFRYAGSTRGLIVPIDHGLTIGPVTGIRNVAEIATWIASPAICGIVAHKGIVERLAARNLLQGKGVILHLNGMSAIAQNPNRKEIVASVSAAVRLGVDGVSIQLNFDGTNDDHNLTLLGEVADEAQRYSLPLLTMLYDKAKATDEQTQFDRLLHLIRITIELGTDAVKLAPIASSERLHSLLSLFSEDVSLYFAGGELMPDEALFNLAEEISLYGGAGLCVGRNIFQRPGPGAVLETLQGILTGRRIAPTLRAANESL